MQKVKRKTTPSKLPKARGDRRQSKRQVVADRRLEERRRIRLRVLEDHRGEDYQFKAILPGHGNDPRTIKGWMKAAGVRSVAIVERCKVKPASVSIVINGRGRSQNIERAISKATRIPLMKLFPAWYPRKK